MVYAYFLCIHRVVIVVNKKFLSKFFTGLIILVNVPFCLANTVANPKQSDWNTSSVKDSSVSVDVDLDPVRFQAEEGIHIATESMEVTDVKTLTATGKWEITRHIFNGEQNLDADTTNLDTRVAMAYVKSINSGTVTGSISLRMSFLAPDLSRETNLEKKEEAINLLKKLQGLKFELKKVDNNGDTTSTYYSATINSVDDGGNVGFQDESSNYLTLDRMSPDAVGVEGSDKTLNLVMRLSMEKNTNLLSQAIQILSELESLGYRFTLQGTVQE